MADIWVFAEYKEGTIRRVTFEALSAARRLADKKRLTVSAVVFGSGVKDESLAPLAHYGADKVIVLDDASLENYTSDAYGHALLELIEKHARISNRRIRRYAFVRASSLFGQSA